MKANVNVIALNNAIKVGSVIPMKQLNGNIGRWIEHTLKKNGYTVNKGKGVDLMVMGVEVKSRKIGSTSGHTVSAMLPRDIINTEWEQSNICNKVQRQYRVKYKENDLTGDNIVISALVYDFTDEFIQKKLKESWNYCRSVLVLGSTEEYIRGKGMWAYLELQENGYYQFRIAHSSMKKMEGIANATRTRMFSR